MTLSPIARAYDHLLIDLDGCLWVGDELTERAAEALSALREAGKGIVFLTNDVRHSPEEFVRKLWRLGARASVDEVVTVGAAVQYLLAERNDSGAAFVIGSQALVDHVADAGLRIVNNTQFATARRPRGRRRPRRRSTTASCGSRRRPCCAARS